MPIRIPDALPATAALESENIFVMTEFRAMHQDIRPLRLLLLNLMPTKIVTETQILRKLSNTPLQVEVELLQTASHDAKNTAQEHLETFYTTFDQVKDQHFDGLIITGAPVELLDFEDVDYWDELCRIMAWSATNVHSTLHICWGAQAGIYFHYGIPKYELQQKLSGVYSHRVEKKSSPLVRGFDTCFCAPHSRYTEVHAADIEAHPDLELIATSDEAGVYLAKSTDSKNFFVFGHPEYDPDTLRAEYERDLGRGLDVPVPAHYFPNDDPTREPASTWRAHAQLLYTNWLNYYVYQTTPYDLDEIGAGESGKAKANATEAGGEQAETGAGKQAADASATKRAAEAANATATEPAAATPATAGAAASPASAIPTSATTPTSTAHTTPAPAASASSAPAPAPAPAAGATATPAPLPTNTNPYLRAPNEDDDGYDPYSDRRYEPPLFEPDPWL